MEQDSNLRLPEEQGIRNNPGLIGRIIGRLTGYPTNSCSRPLELEIQGENTISDQAVETADEEFDRIATKLGFERADGEYFGAGPKYDRPGPMTLNPYTHRHKPSRDI